MSKKGEATSEASAEVNNRICGLCIPRSTGSSGADGHKNFATGPKHSCVQRQLC